MLWDGNMKIKDITWSWGFPGGAVAKKPPARAGATGDVGLIPGLRRSPWEGNGNPLQIFLPGKSHGNPWEMPQAVVHGIAKSWTGLGDYTPPPDSNTFCHIRQSIELTIKMRSGNNVNTLHWCHFKELKTPMGAP